LSARSVVVNPETIGLPEPSRVAIRMLHNATELLDWLDEYVRQIREQGKKFDLAEIGVYHRHIEVMLKAAESHMRLAEYAGRDQ
jgi:hypothetical protein